MIDDIETTSAIETQPHDRTDHPVTNRIHPYVFRAIALLALWFVLGAWGFFAPTGYVGLALAVVSVLSSLRWACPLFCRALPKKGERSIRPPSVRARSESGSRAMSIPGRQGSADGTRSSRSYCRSSPARLA